MGLNYHINYSSDDLIATIYYLLSISVSRSQIGLKIMPMNKMNKAHP